MNTTSKIEVISYTEWAINRPKIQVRWQGSEIATVSRSERTTFFIKEDGEVEFSTPRRKVVVPLQVGNNVTIRLGWSQDGKHLLARVVGAQAEACAARIERTVLQSVRFGEHRVLLFSDGCVQVLDWRGRGAVEPLVSIEFDADVQKKRAVGRGAAAVLTGGANLVLAGNQRGDAYLTIVTERSSYALRSAPSQASLTLGRSLAARGKALVEARRNAAAVSPSLPEPTPDISARLRQLAALHADGLVSDEEYANLRQRALDSL